jgi:hypothetical protein
MYGNVAGQLHEITSKQTQNIILKIHVFKAISYSSNFYGKSTCVKGRYKRHGRTTALQENTSIADLQGKIIIMSLLHW